MFLTLNVFGEENYELEVFVDNLDHPWSLVELSSGEFLLTELPGNIKLISKNGSKITEISNVPKVLFRGQGGLSDIVLHPEYNNNGWIYFSYSAYIDEKNKLNTLFEAGEELHILIMNVEAFSTIKGLNFAKKFLITFVVSLAIILTGERSIVIKLLLSLLIFIFFIQNNLNRKHTLWLKKYLN